MADQVSNDHPDHTHRRALLKALAAAPVILTVSPVGARAAQSNRSECSNIAGLPAEDIPPQCMSLLGL